MIFRSSMRNIAGLSLTETQQAARMPRASERAKANHKNQSFLKNIIIVITSLLGMI